MDIEPNEAQPQQPAHSIRVETTTERVRFRLIITPCCGHSLCWINPRFPTYCPECGKIVYPEIKAHVRYLDEDAVLILKKQN